MGFPSRCGVDCAAIVRGAAGKGTRAGCKHDQLTDRRSRRRNAALPNGGTRPSSDSVAWLHTDFTHVAAYHPATRREIHGDRTRPARHWRFVDPQGRTAIANHVFGCQTAYQDYNRRMASAADGSSRPAPALDVGLLVDNMPMLAWSSHADGSVDFVNQLWREYTGLSTEESHGPGWKAAVHPDDLLGLLQQWETQP